MTNEEANLTIDYLKEMQEGYIEGEGYERHPLPEWYALDKAIEVLEWAKWIPVSERLPQVNEWVLCQCRAGYKVLRLTSYGCYCNDTQEYMDSFVIAWMPLPKPYKPQKISYTVEQDLNEYTGNIEIIEKKY